MRPVSLTAFYCCGIRMLDAQSARPVCGDTLAERFIDDEAARILERFLPFPKPNASNVARHRIIDDLLRARLRANPRQRVLVIGAGFDTRPYRLEGGRWIEVDEPKLIAYKNARLPVRDAPNPVIRLPVDFATESLREKLAEVGGDEPMVVVIEGVLMYLTAAEIRLLAETVRGLFPRSEIICDLMTRSFMRQYTGPFEEELGRLGTSFRAHKVHPATFIQAQGFRPTARYSILRRAIDEGTLPIPPWVFRTFLRTAREGYVVWVFESTEPRRAT